MAAPTVGTVVVVRFPFSDLMHAKRRPALVLADAGRDDYVLCQITSNPYADSKAVELDDASFSSGGLQRRSYVRPGKLFTANAEIIEHEVGVLKHEVHGRIVETIVQLLRAGTPSK